MPVAKTAIVPPRDPDVFHDRPQALPLPTRIRLLIYNRQHATVLNRNIYEWMRFFLFYIVFYSFLSLLIYISYECFMQTIDPLKPKYILGDSLIGTSPGMSVRPVPPLEDAESIFIHIRMNEENKQLASNLYEFLRPYNNTHPNAIDCDNEEKLSDDQVCQVDLNLLGECYSDDQFSFNTSQPCILLKLNRIYGWVPQVYNDSLDLPKDVPKQLKQYIESGGGMGLQETVWITCEGLRAEDGKNLGDIEFFPNPGFAKHYYPYLNQKGYMSPLVGIRFQNVSTMVVINVVCKAWAKNIKHDYKNSIGLVQFSLLVE